MWFYDNGYAEGKPTEQRMFEAIQKNVQQHKQQLKKSFLEKQTRFLPNKAKLQCTLDGYALLTRDPINIVLALVGYGALENENFEEFFYEAGNDTKDYAAQYKCPFPSEDGQMADALSVVIVNDRGYYIITQDDEKRCKWFTIYEGERDWCNWYGRLSGHVIRADLRYDPGEKPLAGAKYLMTCYNSWDKVNEKCTYDEWGKPHGHLIGYHSKDRYDVPTEEFRATFDHGQLVGTIFAAEGRFSVADLGIKQVDFDFASGLKMPATFKTSKKKQQLWTNLQFHLRLYLSHAHFDYFEKQQEKMAREWADQQALNPMKKT